MDGKEYSIEKITGLKKGKKLAVFSRKFAINLEKYAANNSKHESYWVRKFKMYYIKQRSTEKLVKENKICLKCEVFQKIFPLDFENQLKSY